jgi:RNA polymerase sigma factor (sigma-70 family)
MPEESYGQKANSRTIHRFLFLLADRKAPSKYMNNFSPLRLITGRDLSHEGLFLARYQQLLAHAIRLTRGNRHLADDLIQDAFLYFTETKPNIEEIENLDAYLYTSLKHLHFAHLRKGMRDPIGELSTADYESAELSLRAAPQSNHLHIYDQLSRICDYALARKSNSRPHALLLLRFFLGYYMEELALVAGISKPIVRKFLHEAQAEVQRALLQPAPRPTLPLARSVGQLPTDTRSEEFLLAIRRFLLDSRQEKCPSRQEWVAHYSGITSSEISAELLGHLTGCRKCLDRVNSILGLPLLVDRHLESIGEHSRKPKNGSGPGAGVGTGQFNLRRARQRSESIAHHEPRKLAIRVDGDERTAHDITPNDNHFVLKLSAKEDPRVIEIVSEQDVCLLTFIVPMSEPGAPQEWHRSRELTDGRILEATLRYGENWPSVEVVYRDTTLETSLKLASQKTEDAVPPAIRVTRNWLEPLFAKIDRMMLPNMNPLLFAASMLGAASIVCFFLWTRSSPRISPNDLLLHAQAQDAAEIRSVRPGVIYQKIRIATPKQTIERALYRDAQGKRRPKPQPLDQDAMQLSTKLATAGVNWDEPLAAGSYRDWHDRRGIQSDVVKRTGEHLLTLTTTVSSGTVAQESLTVRDNDFHPVARTIQFRDSETVDIAELNYDVMPWGAMNSDWFEPLSNLSAAPAHSSPALSPLRLHSLSGDQIDVAELEARLVLNQLQADTSERLEITRDASGIEVKGIVATSERKHDIESHLRQVAHVTTSISTFQDLQNHPTEGIQITSISASSSVASLSPLARYLLAKGISPDEAANISQELMNSALIVKQHSKAIDELSRRFTTESNLSILARSALDQLMERHRTALLTALQDEERYIAQAGFPSETPHPSTDTESLMSAEEKNIALCVELTSGNNAPPHSAEMLLPELVTSAAQLHTVAVSVQSDPEPSAKAASLPRPTEKQP